MKSWVLKVSLTEERRLWRIFDVPGECAAFDFCAAILSAFDTCACHLFHLEDGDVIYHVYPPEFPDDRHHDLLLEDYTVDELDLRPGKLLKMCYDYGIYQQFDIECLETGESSGSKTLPVLLDGNGCGMIEDVDAQELSGLIDRSENDPDFQFYYEAKRKPWVWNDFDKQSISLRMKREIPDIRNGYFDED